MKLIFTVYLAVIGLTAIAVTASDKYVASHKKRARRVPEKTLLIISALGGSVAMLITMLLIRHKTRKAKFMLGIPLIIALQAGAVYLAYRMGVRI